MKKAFFPRTIWQSILLILLGVILAAPTVFLERTLFEGFSPAVTSTVEYCCVMFGIIILSYWVNRRKGIRFDLSYNISYNELLPLMGLLVISFQFGLNLPGQRLIGVVLNSDIPLTNPLTSPMVLLGALILGPILEEVVFRGIVLRGLLSTYSPSKSIWISAIIFGLIHFEPILIPSAILFGLFFGYVYVKTRSLGLPVILHFMANLSGILANYLSYSMGGVNDSVFGLYGYLSPWLLGSMILLFMLTSFFLFRKLELTLNRKDKVTL
jgi:uncharacterized protein